MMQTLLARFSIGKELVQFLWINKIWWAIPVIVVILLVVCILFIYHPVALVPFTYSLF